MVARVHPDEYGPKIVLIVKMFSDWLELELWRRGESKPSTSVTVIRATEADSSPWTAGTAISIPFEDIMLREKRPGEADFVLSQHFLTNLARGAFAV